jgi:hypothetical protein
VIKSRKLKWAQLRGDLYNITVRGPEGRAHLGDLGVSLHVKVILKHMFKAERLRIWTPPNVVQDRVYWWGLVNRVMNLPNTRNANR